MHIELWKNKPQTVILVSEHPSWQGKSCCLPSRPPFSQRLEDTQAGGGCCPGSRGQAAGRLLMRGAWTGAGPASLRGWARGSGNSPPVRGRSARPQPQARPEAGQGVSTHSLRTRDCPPPRRGVGGDAEASCSARVSPSRAPAAPLPQPIPRLVSALAALRASASFVGEVSCVPPLSEWPCPVAPLGPCGGT